MNEKRIPVPRSRQHQIRDPLLNSCARNLHISADSGRAEGIVRGVYRTPAYGSVLSFSPWLGLDSLPDGSRALTVMV